MNGRGEYGPTEKLTPARAIAPKLAARRRAIRSVFDMYTHEVAPYYVYAEVNGVIERRAATMLDDANTIFSALAQAPGDVYVAIFAVSDAHWPGPAFDIYRHAPATPSSTFADRGHERGTYGRAHVGSLFHTRGDFEQGLKQIAAGFESLMHEFWSRVGIKPEDITTDYASFSRDPKRYLATRKQALATLEASPLYPFWDTYLKGIYAAWNDFRADPITLGEALTGGPFALGPGLWDKLEKWQKLLEQARHETSIALKRAGKAPLKSPSPTELPTSMFERGENVAKDVGGAIWDVGKLAKWTVIGVLGIGGAVVVSSLIANVRKGHDPIARYADIYRDLRRPKHRALKEIEDVEEVAPLPPSRLLEAGT